MRRIFCKLHIGVTDDGNIIAVEVTTLKERDITTVPKLFKQTTNKLNTIVGDAGY